MKRVLQYQGELATIVVCSIFVLNHFFPIVLQPSQFLFNAEGDGIKNIYSFIWHILYDVDAWQTTSMNYPFGESVFYIDAQPAFSVPFQQFNKIIPLSGNFWLAIFNYLLLMSIPLSALIFYKIFRFFHANWIISVLFSVGLVLNSPQIHRLSGHFGLSYMWVLGFTIYFLIRHLRVKSNNNILALFGIILLGFFIHPYLGVISMLLSVLVLAIQWLQSPKEEMNWRTAFPIAIVFIPLAILMITTSISDDHLGRLQNPYGFYEYTSTLKGLFLPNGIELPEVLSEWLSAGSSGEDYNYLGITGGVLFLFTLISFYKKEIGKELGTLFLASALLLVFSFGFPFFYGLEAIPEKFPILKVFRALGRFAWPFYYIIFIVGLFQIPKVLSKLNSNKLTIIYSILGMILLVEGNLSMSSMGSKVTEYQLFDSGLSPIKTTDYAAIIPIPFYNIGSDNYTCQGSNQSVLMSMKYSLNTGIPLLAHHGARQSISEAKDLMGLIGRYDFPKSIGEDGIVGEKFLVVSTLEKLNRQEEILVSQASLLNDYQSLFEISGEALYRGGIPKNQIADSSFFHLNFDQSQADVAYEGQGSLTLSKNGFSKVCDISKGLENGEYLLQFWVYTDGDNYGEGKTNNCFIVIEESDENGGVNWLANAPINNSFVYDGNWCLVEIPFKTYANGKRISVQLAGNDKSGNTVIIDELKVIELN